MVRLVMRATGRFRRRDERLRMEAHSLIKSVTFVTLLFAVSATGETGTGYEVSWSTIDGGGLMFLLGDGYEVSGTIGQPDAGTLSGGAHSVAGGFWTGGSPRSVDPPVAVSSFQRFLGMILPTSSAGTNTAYRVTMVTLYDPDNPQPVDQPDHSGSEGEVRYLNLLRDFNGVVVTQCVSSSAFDTTYPCVSVGCDPHFVDWGALFGGVTAYVSGNAIIPDSKYTVAHLGASCSATAATCADASEEIGFETARYGDSEPSGSVNVTDVVNTVDVVKQLFASLLEYQVYIRNPSPVPQGEATNVTDIVLHVDALKLVAYNLPITSCP